MLWSSCFFKICVWSIMLIDYNYTWLVISLSQWLWSHVWIYFGTHQSGSARRSYSSWARADHPRVSQAACRKGNQSSLKENLLFLSQNDFGNLNFHQCKYVSLFCSEANWYHVFPLSCYSATSRLTLAPRKGASKLTLVLEVLPQAGELEQGVAREATGALQH